MQATQPIIVGHRGLGQNTRNTTEEEVTENTIESFAAAAALGVTWVEFDVQYTKDKRFIVWHDDKIVYRKKHFQVTEGEPNQVLSAYIHTLSCKQLSEILTTHEILRHDFDSNEDYPVTVEALDTDEGISDSLNAGWYVWQNAPTKLLYLDDVMTTAVHGLVGYNIELKIPPPKTLNCAFIRKVCGALTEMLGNSPTPYRIVLSSFSMLACVELIKNGHHNVMLLTEDEAIGNVVQTCVASGMPGIVAHVSQLVDHEDEIDCEAGIHIWCYGGKHHLATHLILDIDHLYN